MNQTLLLILTMISAQKVQRVVGKSTFFVFTSNKAAWLTGIGVGRVVDSGSSQLDVVTAGFLLAVESQSYCYVI